MSYGRPTSSEIVIKNTGIHPREFLALVPSTDYEVIDCIFLSGSLFDGLGRVGSDVDMYVVGAIPTSQFVNSVEFTLNECACEVELKFVSRTSIQGIIASLGPTRNNVLLSDYDQVLSYRIAIGQPIFGEEYFQSIKVHCDRARLAGYFADEFQAVALKAYRSMDLAIQEGDWLSALFLAHTLINYSFQCYMAAHGDCNPIQKWLIRRAKRTLRSGDRLYDEFLRLTLCHGPVISIAEQARHIDECIAFHQDAFDFAALRTYSNDLSSALVVAKYPDISQEVRRVYRRAKECSLVRHGDKYILCRSGKAQFELEPAAVALWLVLGCRDLDSALRHASNLCQIFSLRTADAQVGSMQEYHGILLSEWISIGLIYEL